MVLGLHLPNHGSQGYDFSSPEARERVESDIRAIRVNSEGFDFRYAVCHPPEACTEEQGYAFYLHNLRRLDIPLVLENSRGISDGAFLDFFMRLREPLGERLTGICLDIPHAHLAGWDWQAFLHRFKHDVRVIHLSDCSAGEDSHLPFGFGGDLSLEDIIETLLAEAFDGVLNLEILPPSISDLGAALDTYDRVTGLLGIETRKKGYKRKRIVIILSRLLECIHRK